VFFVNLPFGIFTVLGLVIFMDETKKDLELRFDWFGFTALASRSARLQLALDRGEQLGWLNPARSWPSSSSRPSASIISSRHSLTTARPFIQFALFRTRISSAAACS
jgi:DHA2 family multidrug resistance protein